MNNFYDELGVPPTATADEIERAYRFLVQKFHPDRNPGHESEAQAHFLRVQNAYETLSDSSKRAAYDKSFRQDQFRPAHISQPNNFEGIKIPWKVRRKRPDIGIRIWLSTAAACLVLIVAISVTKNDTKDKTQSLPSSLSLKDKGDAPKANNQKPDGIGSPVQKPSEPNPAPLDKNVPEPPPESTPPPVPDKLPPLEDTPVPLSPAPQEEPPDANKPFKVTQDRLARFFADFQDMLKKIGNQPTTIRRDEMRPILAKKLDENLYSQTWTFHCRISDVKADPEDLVHKFIIVHYLPDEMSNLDPSWTARTSAELRLPREQAIHLNPGNYIVYSGTPQLVTVEIYKQNKRTDGFLLDEHDGFALCLMHVQAGFPKAKTP